MGKPRLNISLLLARFFLRPVVSCHLTAAKNRSLPNDSVSTCAGSREVPSVPCSGPPGVVAHEGSSPPLPCGAFFLLPLLTCQTFLFQRLEMCQQSSEEGFCFRLFLVVHSPFQVQDARELFRAWDSEHVKDQPSRQIVQCNLFAVCELKYVPLWAFAF